MNCLFPGLIVFIAALFGPGAQMLWNLRGKVTAFYSGSENIVTIAFSPDGEKVAFGASVGRVEICSCSTAQRIVSFDAKAGALLLDRLIFSGDSRMLATTHVWGDPQLWEVVSGKARTEGTQTAFPQGLFLIRSDSGKLLLVGIDGPKTNRMQGIWDISGGKPRTLTVIRQDDFPWDISALSPDGNAIAGLQDSRTVAIWNIKKKHPLPVLRHRDELNRARMVFSHDSTKLLTTDKSNVLRIWSIETGNLICTLSGHNALINAIAFSRDGTTLVSCSNDCTIRLWDIGKNRECARWIHSDFVNDVAFSPIGNKIAFCSDGFAGILTCPAEKRLP